MAPCTELRCRCADHGVVGEAEKWEGDDKADADEDGWFDYLSHHPLLSLGVIVEKWRNRRLGSPESGGPRRLVV